MIHRVSSNREEFKDVSFKPGFNVILAERTTEASDRESRNGSGKTSLVEIIHFCLGADLGRGPLSHEVLEGWNFTTELDVGGHRISVTRDTAEPRKIWLSGDTTAWPVEIKNDRDRDESYITVEDWKIVLGAEAFSLDPAAEDARFAPSARVLTSYFIRRGRDGFADPFSTFRNQPSWSRQVNTATLLGLDWTFPRRAQLLSQEEEGVRKARVAVEEWRETAARSQPAGFVPSEATEGSLEATRIALASRAQTFAEQLMSFHVHPQYEEYEAQAAALTGRIHDLVNESVVAREVLEHYDRTLAEEEIAPEARVEELYAEMGLHFSEQLVERLDAVRNFHRRIIANRREYLGGEIGRINGEVEARDRQVEELSDRRAELLAFLAEHGALEELLRLQEEQQRAQDQLARVETQIEELRRFEVESARLRIEREELRLAARGDFDERRPIWSKAVELFGSNTGFLYEQPGQLI